MARPIFHKFQIEAVQHGADGDAEEHSKNAERLTADCDRHQHEDSRKADGFSDDPGIDQIPFELLQDKQECDKPHGLHRLRQQNQQRANAAAKPCTKDWNQRGHSHKD